MSETGGAVGVRSCGSPAARRGPRAPRHPAGRAAAQRGTRTLKIGYVSPQTGPLAGFGETDNFVVGGVRKAVGERADDPGAELPGRDPRARQPVGSEPRRRGRLAPDPVRQGRPHAGGEHAGDDQSGVRPVRGQRHARASRACARGSRGSSRRGGKPETGFKSTYHFFWGLEDIIGVFVDMWNTLADQQGRRRALAQRRRRQRVGRQGARLPARAGQGRLQAGRSRPLSESLRRLLGADLHLQEREGRDRDRRADPAGLDDVLEAGRPAGLQARRSPSSARRCSSRARSRRSATSATACPPRCGGRRSIRSSRR